MQAFTLHANHPDREIERAMLSAFIDKLPVGKSWRIRIDRYVKSRTDPQNRALWGVAYPALEAATGFTKDELHVAFCRQFFGSVTVEVFGQTIVRPVRTTTTDEDGRADKISTAQFSEFYALVQRIGAESGVYVPDPDPMREAA